MTPEKAFPKTVLLGLLFLVIPIFYYLFTSIADFDFLSTNQRKRHSSSSSFTSFVKSFLSLPKNEDSSILQGKLDVLHEKEIKLSVLKKIIFKKIEECNNTNDIVDKFNLAYDLLYDIIKLDNKINGNLKDYMLLKMEEVDISSSKEILKDCQKHLDIERKIDGVEEEEIFYKFRSVFHRERNLLKANLHAEQTKFRSSKKNLGETKFRYIFHGKSIHYVKRIVGFCNYLESIINKCIDTKKTFQYSLNDLFPDYNEAFTALFENENNEIVVKELSERFEFERLDSFMNLVKNGVLYFNMCFKDIEEGNEILKIPDLKGIERDLEEAIKVVVEYKIGKEKELSQYKEYLNDAIRKDASDKVGMEYMERRKLEIDVDCIKYQIKLVDDVHNSEDFYKEALEFMRKRGSGVNTQRKQKEIERLMNINTIELENYVEEMKNLMIEKDYLVKSDIVENIYDFCGGENDEIFELLKNFHEVGNDLKEHAKDIVKSHS